MNTGNEFGRVKNAFIKVKKDVEYLNNNIIDLKAQKADRINVDRIIREVNELRDIIVEVSLKVNGDSGKKGEVLEVWGNSDSKKAHFSNCPFARRITKEHKVVFKDMADALNHKYSKCTCLK